MWDSKPITAINTNWFPHYIIFRVMNNKYKTMCLKFENLIKLIQFHFRVDLIIDTLPTDGDEQTTCDMTTMVSAVVIVRYISRNRTVHIIL